MTIKTKSIRTTAETSLEDFNDVKDFLCNLDNGVYLYVNNYVVAYVLVRNHGYEATKIHNVCIDMTNNTVAIDFETIYHFETKYHKEEDIEND